MERISLCVKTSSKSFYHYDEVVCHKRWILSLSAISIYSFYSGTTIDIDNPKIEDYGERENSLIIHNGFFFQRSFDKILECHG